jgi:hypothetical protein
VTTAATLVAELGYVYSVVVVVAVAEVVVVVVVMLWLVVRHAPIVRG